MLHECRFQGCSKLYPGILQRDYHERRHQGSQDRSFTCNVDGCTFRAYPHANLKAHISAEHHDQSGLPRIKWMHNDELTELVEASHPVSPPTIPCIPSPPSLPVPQDFRQSTSDQATRFAPSSSATTVLDFRPGRTPIDRKGKGHQVPNNNTYTNTLYDDEQQQQLRREDVPLVVRSASATLGDPDRRVFLQVEGVPAIFQASRRTQLFGDASRDLPCPWAHGNPEERMHSGRVRSSDYIPSADARLLFG